MIYKLRKQVINIQNKLHNICLLSLKNCDCLGKEAAPRAWERCCRGNMKLHILPMKNLTLLEHGREGAI